MLAGCRIRTVTAGTSPRASKRCPPKRCSAEPRRSTADPCEAREDSTLWRQPDFSQPNEPALTLRLRRDDVSLAFLTTLTNFNAPGNVTLEELTIESYFPLDRATELACAALASAS